MEILTVLLSFFTIFRFTSAMRHLFTLAWFRSGGFTNATTTVHNRFDGADGEGRETPRTVERLSRVVEELFNNQLDVPPQVGVVAPELEG